MNRRNFFKLTFGTLGALAIAAVIPKTLLAKTPEYVPGVIAFPPVVEPLPDYTSIDAINRRHLALQIQNKLECIIGEFNDNATRKRVYMMTAEFLEDAKKRRAVDDYVVVCDESNNTPDVIDDRTLRVDTFIRDKRSSFTFHKTMFLVGRHPANWDDLVS